MFDPASVVKPLTEEQCRALAVAAFRRILAAESESSGDTAPSAVDSPVKCVVTLQR